MRSRRRLEEQNTFASTMCPEQSARQWGVIPHQTTLVTLWLVYVPPVAAAVTLPLQPRYGFGAGRGGA